MTAATKGRFRQAIASGLLVLSTGVVVACAVGRAGPGVEGLTRTQRDEFVRAHNEWRRKAGAPPLRWADDLAARAQARATHLALHGFVMEHGRLPGDVGENLFKATPRYGEGRANTLATITPTMVVDAWGAESADYSAERGACAPNRQCGHYTQLVWRATREVGCGMAVCPALGQIWVCNYRPAGNITVG